MKLTVLGCYGSFPGPGGACSGYLVQHGNTNILFDCGNGTIGRAQQFIKIEDIDAIVLSHLHMDHIADAFVLKYALESKTAIGQKLGKIKLVMPQAANTQAAELCDGNVFDVTTVTDGSGVSIDGIDLSFSRVPHLIECYAICANAGGKRLAYSGDTGSCEKLADIASNVDLFLCESTLVTPVKGLEHHLSARDAARYAELGRAKRLLLTHFWYETPKRDYVAEASAYHGNVEAAEEMKTYGL